MSKEMFYKYALIPTYGTVLVHIGGGKLQNPVARQERESSLLVAAPVIA